MAVSYGQTGPLVTHQDPKLVQKLHLAYSLIGSSTIICEDDWLQYFPDWVFCVDHGCMSSSALFLEFIQHLDGETVIGPIRVVCAGWISMM